MEVAEVAVSFANKHKIPVIIDIRDEWPDEFVDLAPKPLRGIARLLLYNYFKRMKYICQNATGIIAVSKSYLNYALSFAKRSIGSNDGVFPLGYSSNRIDEEKLAEAKNWWKKQGVDESAFICCFFGTIGKFFNLETVIEAAKILSKEFQIQFVLCGDGSSLGRYKKLALGINSVIFPGWVDASKIFALMEIADVGLAPYAANTRMSLPNKPFEYFAGGLSVVSSIQGELKQILTDNGCGFTYDPDSVSSLCDVLRKLHGDEILCKSMARQAIHLSKEKFSIEHISSEFNEHIIRVVEKFKKLSEEM
ncbi:MAG: glycosyltransferase family 4 protein [Deltaproteobacteria bacterium]|nr:glycosyltransferase family 4 protein [Deltaproteobacteria bacterium]